MTLPSPSRFAVPIVFGMALLLSAACSNESAEENDEAVAGVTGHEDPRSSDGAPGSPAPAEERANGTPVDERPLPASGTYRGTCDGSGGVALDADHFLGVNDEDQVLRVYRRGADATPAFQLDVTAQLGLAEDEEADFEEIALGSDGKRMYVISSHGRSSKGTLQAARHRFVAIELAGSAPQPELRVVGHSATLVADLLDAANWVTPDAAVISALQLSAQPGVAKDAALAPEKSGLSIEGLGLFPSTAEPHRLVMGLRNPQLGESALLITLLNPDEVATGAKARLGEAFALNLSGLGIRSLAWSAEAGAFYILAGPRSTGGPFRVYRWSGPRETPPEMIRELDAPANRSPEGLVLYPGSSDAQLLLDMGDELVGDTLCKDVPAEARAFSDFSVRLP